MIQEIIINEDIKSVQSEKALLNEPTIKQIKGEVENGQNMHELVCSHLLTPQNNEPPVVFENADIVLYPFSFIQMKRPVQDFSNSWIPISK